MDWLIPTIEQHHTISAPTEEIAPASPSVGPADGPGFALRCSRDTRTAAPTGLLPPQLRFPESRAYWTV